MGTVQGFLAVTYRSAFGRASGPRLRRRVRRSFSADAAALGENGIMRAKRHFGAKADFLFGAKARFIFGASAFPLYDRNAFLACVGFSPIVGITRNNPQGRFQFLSLKITPPPPPTAHPFRPYLQKKSNEMPGEFASESALF